MSASARRLAVSERNFLFWVVCRGADGRTKKLCSRFASLQFGIPNMHLGGELVQCS